MNSQKQLIIEKIKTLERQYSNVKTLQIDQKNTSKNLNYLSQNNKYHKYNHHSNSVFIDHISRDCSYIEQHSNNSIKLQRKKYLQLSQKIVNKNLNNISPKKIISLLQKNHQQIQNYITQFPQKNLKQKNKQLPLIINLTNTKYSVIQNAANQMKFKISYQNDINLNSLNWDIKWTDVGLGPEYVKKLNQNQRINYFIGINSIARKNLLMMNLYNMKSMFYEEYNFFPQTFQYPNDFSKLQKFYRDKKKNNQSPTFIVKPEASCQGRGIYLTQNLQQIDNSSKSIVQHYISRPMLYEGLKFDFRIYVLLKSVNPLQIYIYKQGLVRFATERYQMPNKYNMDDLCIHLTNYAINKSNPKYQFNQSLRNLNYGHKKSLAEFMKSLKEKGYNSLQIWRQIKINIIKTIIAVQPHLNYEYRKAQPKNQQKSVCFQVLGFDFMVDQNNKVQLLQVNQSPSFSTDSPLDFLVKNYLIKDTLSIIKQDRTKNKIKKYQIIQRAKTQAYSSLQELENKIQVKNISQTSNYELIYPSKDFNTQAGYQNLIRQCTRIFHNSSFNNSAPIIKSPQKENQKGNYLISSLTNKQCLNVHFNILHSPNLKKANTLGKIENIRQIKIEQKSPNNKKIHLIQKISQSPKKKILLNFQNLETIKQRSSSKYDIIDKITQNSTINHKTIEKNSILSQKSSQKIILLNKNRNQLYSNINKIQPFFRSYESDKSQYAQKLKILNIIDQIEKNQNERTIKNQFQQKRKKQVILNKVQDDSQKVVQQTPLQKFMKYLNPLNKITVHRQIKQVSQNKINNDE